MEMGESAADPSGQVSAFHLQLGQLAAEYDRLLAENCQLKLLVPTVDTGYIGRVSSTTPHAFQAPCSTDAWLDCDVLGDRKSLDSATVRAAKMSLRKERSWMGSRTAALCSPGHADHDSADTLQLALPRAVLQHEAVHLTANGSTSESQDTAAQQPLNKSVTSLTMQGKNLFDELGAPQDKHGHAGPKANRKMFGPDSDAMKEQVRQQMLGAEAAYDVKNFYKTSGWCQAVARNMWFENITLSMIAFYAVWMAVDTDHNDADVITKAHWVFFVAEQIFCTYFFVELVIRFGAFKDKRYCLMDAWFVFDSFLVFAMVLEVWAMTVVVYATASSGSSTSMLGNASILRVARLLRLSRLFRMARLVRMVPELLIMIKAILAAARSVLFTLMLLVIVLYIFGIAMVQTMKDTDLGDEKFTNVITAMQSLFLHGTLLDDVSAVFEALQAQSVMGMILMYLFIILAAITVMNMLIGVLCEVITAVAAAEKEAIKVSWVKSILQDVMNLDGDENTDGKLQKSEFFRMLQNKEAVEALQAVDVDVVTLVDFADIIFEEKETTEDATFMTLRTTARRNEPTAKDGGAEDDEEEIHAESSISFVDFMEMVLQLRMTNTATVKDVVDLRKFLGLRFKVLEEMIRQLQLAARPSKMPTSQAISPIVPLDPRGTEPPHGQAPALMTRSPSNQVRLAEDAPTLPGLVAQDADMPTASDSLREAAAAGEV